MTLYLLDTNIISNITKPAPSEPLIGWMADQDDGALFISSLTVAEIRDLLGTTRKFAVPICEYLDRVGVTRREGDLRLLARA